MIQNFSLKQKKLLIIVGIVVIIGIMYYIYSKTETNNELEEDILVQNIEEPIKNGTAKEFEENEIIVVHITGAVKNPRNC